MESISKSAADGACDLRRIGAHPDHWYPVAWSSELKGRKPLACRFAEEPIVLFRGTSGQVFALEDRCAHRQVPLHLGVVHGDAIKCGYHGWSFDCSGQCIDIPNLGRQRLPSGVKSYPVCEVDGMIFVFPGDVSLAEARKPDRIGASADGRYVTRRLKREVACHYSFMHENLFDMNHQFLHRRQMGFISVSCLGRRKGEDWCEVDYTFQRSAGRQSFGEAAIVNVFDSKTTEKPHARGDLMTIRTAYPYQRLKFWSGEGDPALDVWLCYTPQDKDQRTNRTFGYLSVRKPRLSGLLYAAWPFITWFTENIFREDKYIVEQEQAAHDAQGADWNNEIFAPVRDLRAVLASCGLPIKSDQEPSGTDSGAQPIPARARG
jgi:phenylpropionate dioxygenase-like ring-hydroxylating dioxygenase large terminal subunit